MNKEKAMRSKWIVAMSLLMFAGTVLGQSCGPQVFRHLDDVDPAQVVTDPVSGNKLLVQVVRAKLGTTVTINGIACDDDGDPLTVWADDVTNGLAVDPTTGAFSFQVMSPGAPQIEYIDIGVTDGVDLRVGTYAVDFRANTPPIIIPQPPDGGSVVAKLRQRGLMMLSKYFGRPIRDGFVFVTQD